MLHVSVSLSSPYGRVEAHKNPEPLSVSLSSLYGRVEAHKKGEGVA